MAEKKETKGNLPLYLFHQGTNYRAYELMGCHPAKRGRGSGYCQKYTMEKENIFNKWCWYNWMSVCRKMKIVPYLSPCTKLKSK